MTGMILQKVQMTQIVKENDMVPVTLLYAPKHVIARFKTEEKDGYNAVVVAVATDKKDLGEFEIPYDLESDTFAELKA